MPQLMTAPLTSARITIIAIPTGDAAFLAMATRLLASGDATTPEAFEQRMRRMFPRTAVRARELSGEKPAWYVYRDGGWRASLQGPWWEAPDLPRIVVGPDGWLAEANPTALGLLEVEPDELTTRHFTDFVVPGTLKDWLTTLEIVAQGHDLTATVLLRPTSGHVLAVDVHAWRDDDRVISVLRLAEDVEPIVPRSAPAHPPVTCIPETDAAFRGYVDRALGRMPEPDPEGLALRLRRLYPHAEVVDSGEQWVVRREPLGESDGSAAWWAEAGLAQVRYDSQAFIVEANPAALALLGRDLVGHHWQEFVTAGSTEEVTAMLAILAELGRAESRFRMPRGDGTLVEFDSYTEVEGDTFTTTMRPRPE